MPALHVRAAFGDGIAANRLLVERRALGHPALHRAGLEIQVQWFAALICGADAVCGDDSGNSNQDGAYGSEDFFHVLGDEPVCVAGFLNASTSPTGFSHLCVSLPFITPPGGGSNRSLAEASQWLWPSPGSFGSGKAAPAPGVGGVASSFFSSSFFSES